VLKVTKMAILVTLRYFAVYAGCNFALLTNMVINFQIWKVPTLKKEHIWQMCCAQTSPYSCCTDSASFGVMFVKVLVYKVVTTWEHDNIAFYFVSCLQYVRIICTKNIN
jgi:hypothetical protein